MHVASTPDLDPLLSWYRRHHRILPWRGNPTPYAVWVSEIMLQQTGVSTVIPYFERWMERFPSVEALAAVDEQAVLSIWQGLGYYRRCRNLLAGASVIADRGWPASAAEWLNIAGVGRYTAGAIASISLGEPTPLVDGNVERVYARCTNDSSAGGELNRNAWRWAERELRRDAPGDWNQALMELGATICTPTSPLCGVCPVQNACLAYKSGRTGELPTTVPKRPAVHLEFDVAVMEDDGLFALKQIPEGEWWHGMWEFPRTQRGLIELAGKPLPSHKHTVTHHRITLFPVLIPLTSPRSDLTWFDATELAELPMPAPQRRILESAQAALRD